MLLRADALGNDDLGSSGVMLVRSCDRLCRDGSECGDLLPGLCANGEVCVSTACADGSECGSGGPGLCDDLQACLPTRFGARCIANGYGDECATEPACRPDAIYFGTKRNCVFSLDIREPYCREPVAGGHRYRPSKWAECGIAEEPGDPGTQDTCNDGSACHYCRGVATGCADGSRCGSGGIDDDGAARCADQTRCLYNTCADGSICTTEGLCASSGLPCDCVKAVCDNGSACGDGGPGLCGASPGQVKQPCFRPRADRARWRFATGGDFIADPVLGTCTSDPAMHWESSLLDGLSNNDRAHGLDPQPVPDDCIFIGDMEHRFYALDEV